MNLQQISQRLVKDEGSKPYAYQDSRGFWTIGNGFCIDIRVDATLPEPVRAFWLTYLVNKTIAQLIDYPSLAGVDDVRKQLVVCLLYNMGEEHLNMFKQMLSALAAGDYTQAAAQLQNSLWFTQVGVRGPIYTRIMQTGVWE